MCLSFREQQMEPIGMAILNNDDGTYVTSNKGGEDDQPFDELS